MNQAPNNTLAEKRVLVIHPLVLRFALLNLERLLCRQPPRGGPSQDEAIVDLSLDDDCAEKITDVYGNQWTIVLCVENESIQWRLFYHGATEFRAQLSLLMRDPKGKLFGSIVYYVSSSGTEMPYFSPKTKCKSGYLGASASEIFDNRNSLLRTSDNALLVDVTIRFKPSADILRVPYNPHSSNMLKLLGSKQSADVWFKIMTELQQRDYGAHSLILEMNAPILSAFGKGSTQDSPNEIRDVLPEIFQMVLHYAYGGLVTRESAGGHEKQLVEAANMFDMAALKVTAEAMLAEKLLLKHDNVVDWLLWADCMTCALVKELAMSYAVSMIQDLLHSDCLDKLRQSKALMSELIMEMSQTVNDDSRLISNRMTVNALRERAEEDGLDMDGSKQTLIRILEESKKRKRLSAQEGEDCIGRILSVQHRDEEEEDDIQEEVAADGEGVEGGGDDEDEEEVGGGDEGGQGEVLGDIIELMIEDDESFLDGFDAPDFEGNQEDEDSSGDEEDGDNIQQNEPSRGKVLRLLR